MDFNGLTLEELGVISWEKIDITKECHLFHKDIYRPKSDCDGFDFKCVNWFCETVGSPNQDDIGRVGYEVLFEGVAYFDGVRHLYFGKEETENYGYLYYPDIHLLVSALRSLDDLQVAKCQYVKEERKQSDE